MRDILFRGKRTEDEEWVFGYYVFLRKRNGICGQQVTDSDFDRGCIVDLFGKQHIVYPETIGQYTGLTDTNGRRIFEGDIVVNDSERALSFKPHAVQFRDGKFTYISDYGDCLRPVRIIGNIYDEV